MCNLAFGLWNDFINKFLLNWTDWMLKQISHNFGMISEKPKVESDVAKVWTLSANDMGDDDLVSKIFFFFLVRRVEYEESWPDGNSQHKPEWLIHFPVRYITHSFVCIRAFWNFKD